MNIKVNEIEKTIYEVNVNNGFLMVAKVTLDTSSHEEITGGYPEPIWKKVSMDYCKKIDRLTMNDDADTELEVTDEVRRLIRDAITDYLN